MQRRPQRETTPARREGILRAFLQLFAERGYLALTMADVSRRSGASIGSIYHHFSGKEQLAAALYIDALGTYQAGLAATLAEQRSARAGITAVVRYHLRWVADHRDLAGYLFHQREPEVLAASQAEVRKLNREFFAKVLAWLRDHVESGEIRRLPPDLYTALLIGPVQEFARHWLATTTTTPIEAAQRALAEGAWNALRRRKEE